MIKKRRVCSLHDTAVATMAIVFIAIASSLFTIGFIIFIA